jgi:two-component system response regulator
MQTDILLIEDNSTDADLTLRALKLKNLHLSVTHVEDGVEALDFIFRKGSFENRLSEHLPKLILMDLKLPKMDGPNVLKEIKRNEITKAIPVVILTSSNQESDIRECYRLGANAYIVKPLEFEDYLHQISSAAYFWMNINCLPDVLL